jgi:ribonuclease HI
MSAAEHVVIYTDGACKGNPGPGGWGAWLRWGAHERELYGGARHTTNNQMELTAAIEALRRLRGAREPIALCTDSSYVVLGITQWVHGWRRRGWTTADGRPVLNRVLWERLAALAAERGRDALTWRHVPGHADVPGNERADAIAVAFAAARPIELYDGPLLDYPIAVHDLPAAGDPPARRTTRRAASSAAPYSYLSLINGQPARHRTWAECERRVKGVSGARFKKAMSAEDEATILASWGCDASQLQR